MAIPPAETTLHSSMAGRVRGLTPGGVGGRIASVVVTVGLLVALLAPRADAQATGPARVVRQGDATARTVALTFDDGWHPGRCQTILDILLEHGVPATWFPNEVYVRRDEELWASDRGAPPDRGNDTIHHDSLPGLSQQGMRRETALNERRIEAVTGGR